MMLIMKGLTKWATSCIEQVNNLCLYLYLYLMFIFLNEGFDQVGY